MKRHRRWNPRTATILRQRADVIFVAVFRYALIFGWIAAAVALPAGWSASPRVRAALVADQTAAVPGSSLRLGVWFRIPDGWHIYWRNSGESGLPTRIRVSLPNGWRAGPWIWPGPQEFTDPGGLRTYGYDREVLIWRTVHVPSHARPGTRVRIRGVVQWLQCARVCIPGKAEVTLALPVRLRARSSPEVSLWDRFAHRRPRTLQEFPGQLKRVATTEDSVIFQVHWIGKSIRGLVWFPHDRRIRVREQRWRIVGPYVYELRVQYHLRNPDVPPSRSGVLRIDLPNGVLYVQTPDGT